MLLLDALKKKTFLHNVFCNAFSCVLVEDGEVIASGSNRTNATGNVGFIAPLDYIRLISSSFVNVVDIFVLSTWAGLYHFESTKHKSEADEHSCCSI